LPDHILESTHFINWRTLFPDDTEFHIHGDMVFPDFNITCQADLDRIIATDDFFGFSKKTRIEIFGKIEEYWNTNPNSAPITLVEHDTSFFANQVRALLEDHNIMPTCMKFGYIELFDYVYENFGRAHDSFESDTLLYYAVVNQNVEMIGRCIEIGLKITSCLIRPAINTGNLEIFKLLLDNNVQILFANESDICEHAPPNMFKLFLEDHVSKRGKSPTTLLIHAVPNLKNLREILTNYDISSEPVNGPYQLLNECIVKSVSLDTVIFIEQYFDVTVKAFKAYYNRNYSTHYYIGNNIIYNDNLDLYEYLYKNGFKVDEEILRIAIKYRRLRITPGLVRKHIADIEKQEIEKQEIENQ
jgi:hypothetical protein